MNFITLNKKIILTFLLIISSTSFAEEFKAQGRLFIGSINSDLSQLNANLKNDGMGTFVSTGQYGLEITYPWKSLNIGMRYHKTNQVVYENPENTATNYRAELLQDEIMLLARAPLYKNGSFLVDIFAGVGGTNTTYRVNSATQNGELTKTAPNDWFASPMGAAGVSVGIGYNRVYGFIEAGYEYNKVSSFERSGSVSNSIQELNLSGHYIILGVMFDGIMASSK